MAILKYKIIQISGRSLLYRKCGNCSSKLVNTVLNEQGRDCFYCDKCEVLAQSFKITYQLQLVVLDTSHNIIDTVIAYDEVTEKLMGCRASEFAELLKQDPLLIRKLEQELVGMYCTVESMNKKNNRRTEKRCKSFTFQYPKDVKVIDILRNQSVNGEIQYDPSLITI